jgi:hypothetical protein
MKKLTKAQQLEQAKKKHESFLLKHNVHPTQLKPRKKDKIVLAEWLEKFYNKLETKQTDKVFQEVNPEATAVRGIFANMHKEPKHVQNAILVKKSRVAPLYNKGGLQLMSEKEDLTQIGNRTRRP